MSNQITLGDDSDDPDAYVYWEKSDKEEDLDEALVLCPDCSGKFYVPPMANRADFYDKPHFGAELPHVFCEFCDEQVTS